MPRLMPVIWRVPDLPRALAACLIVAVWFLWPFSDLSAPTLTYAVLAGSGLLLASRGVAWLLSPSPATGRIRPAAATFGAALLVGLWCSLGLWVIAAVPGTFPVLQELWERTLDAGACGLASLLLLAPHSRPR